MGCSDRWDLGPIHGPNSEVEWITGRDGGPSGNWHYYYQRQEGEQLNRYKSIDVHPTNTLRSHLTNAQWSVISLLSHLLLLGITSEYFQQRKHFILPCPHLNYYMTSWHALLSLQAMRALSGRESLFHLSYIQCQDNDWPTGVSPMCASACVSVCTF